ncbi:hypothetical protein [Pedobacter jejuensis]|uniref:Uncharacterized protein n=1 Tax=Pedobacter jejuensis TaxID=1268550 RepID=A0A3N0BY73_9SPHI|nr:hypothetical protein [Pedobacter jejuensis]RNL54212.1 hypothetical protein D7004_08965 [Pedobacter jejuensis]
MNFTKALFCGFFLLSLSIYILFHDLFFNANELIKIKSKLENSEVSTEIKKVPKKYFGEDIYTYAVIRFKLKQVNQNFELLENITKLQSSENNMERLNSVLKDSEYISVFIRKSDLNNRFPDIYRIDADEYNAYNYEKKKSNQFTLFFILVGSSSFFFVIHFMILKIKSKESQDKTL